MTATMADLDHPDWLLMGPAVRGRKCGGCTLCCTLLPVKEIRKADNVRCVHQRHTGCGIYARRPLSCYAFSCRWLMDASTEGLRRPDRAGYVIDASLDTILVNKEPQEVVQVWVDPRRPDAHRDPALRRWLSEIAEKYRMVAIIRFSSTDGFILAAPCLTGTGDWIEHRSDNVMTEEESQALRYERLMRVRAE